MMDCFTVVTNFASTKVSRHLVPTSNTCGQIRILMGILLKHSWTPTGRDICPSKGIQALSSLESRDE